MGVGVEMIELQERIYNSLSYLRLKVQDGTYGRAQDGTFNLQKFKDALQFHLLEDLEE